MCCTCTVSHRSPITDCRFGSSHAHEKSASSIALAQFLPTFCFGFSSSDVSGSSTSKGSGLGFATRSSGMGTAVLASRSRFVRRAPPSFHDVAVHALSCMRHPTHVLLCNTEHVHGPPRIGSTTSCVTEARVSGNKSPCSNFYLLHRLMLSWRVFVTRDEAAKLVANRPKRDGRANHSPRPVSASMADMMEST